MPNKSNAARNGYSRADSVPKLTCFGANWSVRKIQAYKATTRERKGCLATPEGKHF